MASYQNKKITLLYPGKLYDSNGASAVIRLLFEGEKRFKENGIDLEVFAADCKNNKLSIPNQGNSPIKIKQGLKSKIQNIILKGLKGTSLKSALEIYLFLLKPSIRISRQYLKIENPAEERVMFIHDLFTCYYFIRYKKTKNQIYLVLHNNGEMFKMLHSNYPDIAQSFWQKYLDRMAKTVLKDVNKVIFVSKNSLERFSEINNAISREKLAYVYNGLPDIKEKLQDIKTEENEFNNGIYEMVCVGSISERKGQEIIIDSLSELSKEELKDFHITFVGDGYLKPKLEKKVRELKLEKYVTFVGDQKNVDKFLKRANIFILTSRDEGLPISIIEAQRHGLPIISTKVAGIPEMIEDGESGFLINPEVPELKTVLQKLKEYDLKKLGIRSREIYKERFSYESMIDKYSQIFTE